MTPQLAIPTSPFQLTASNARPTSRTMWPLSKGKAGQGSSSSKACCGVDMGRENFLTVLGPVAQADIEVDRARQAQVVQQQQQAKEAASALSDEEDEEQVMRQRAKDDYRDTHPTGWGNSKLRPCA